ncbi:TetR/AcrR family transcriptional regulator [Planktotalea sp.]|uniref:TetR/AcrR family transcriptional regulator n=1 Tax=Planktotalea sp. TaxID=2029877 RepID=UPI0032987D29
MDRRIAKTQNALIQALGDCLTKYPWEDVSVQLLCDTADVSRSAFYAHFDSKQDLLDLAMKAMASRLKSDSHERRSLRSNGKISILPALLRHMRDHLFLFETTNASMAGRALAHHFETMVGRTIEAEIRASQFSSTMSERKVRFLIGGLFALLDDWREGRCAEPDEEMLAELDQAADLVFSSNN